MKPLQTAESALMLSDSTRHHLGLHALIAASVVAFGFLTVANPLFAANTERVYSFTGADGVGPGAGLIRDAFGNLYGTTSIGGIFSSNCYLGQFLGCGTVFQLTPRANGTWTETVLYEFTGSPDGTEPEASLVLGHDGNLYGTTNSGGVSGGNLCFSFGCGIVFRLSRAANGEWTEEVLHSFNGNDGGNPAAGLILDADGNLYGTASLGGLCYSCGTVFELTPNASGGWNYTVLYYFPSPEGVEGAGPYAGLTFDAAGNLYGTTISGGAYDCGTAFELKRGKGNKWVEHVLYSFNTNGDGCSPSSSLTFDKAGNLYGTTGRGGQAELGTAYRLKPDANGEWTEEILYSFCSADDCTDGASPTGLSSDAEGNLYGTAYQGGLTGYGVAFELTPGLNSTWTETVLHAFNQDGKDGTSPYSGVILDSAGNLYGTTSSGGTGCKKYNGCGTVFEITR